MPALADRSYTQVAGKGCTAWLGYALIAKHAFVDGNKRIGMYAMLTFLEVNGIRLNCRNDEVVKVGLGIASGAMKYEDVLTWVNEHQI